MNASLLHQVWDKYHSPALEAQGRIDFQIFFESFFEYEGQYETSLSLVPVFPFCDDTLKDYPVVWNLDSLIGSFKCPGNYELLTCSCGYAPHAGINDGVHVSHPNDTTIIWELDINDFRSVLQPLESSNGYIRFTFDRAEYERSIRSMLEKMRETASKPLTPAQFLLFSDPQEWGELSPMVVEYFEPNTDDIAEFLQEYANAPWTCQPLFERGTEIEIGIWDDGFWRVNGKFSLKWIGRYFTRWAVTSAFRQWMTTIRRRPAQNVSPSLNDSWTVNNGATEVTSNTFIPAEGHSQEESHQAGRFFTEVFSRGLAEGNTAPGVTVRYVE